MVVCSKESRKDIRSVLSAIFSDTIFTPQPEPVYKIKFIEPNDYAKIKQQVNIIFGSIGTDESDPGTRLVKSLLSTSQFNASINGTNQLILSENLFAQDQLALIISGEDLPQIKDRAQIQGSKILALYASLYEKRQTKYLFENARQNDLEARLKNSYGWSMKIPWGYAIIREDADLGLFWMGRDIPYRWFAVHWSDGIIASDSLSASNYFREFTSNTLETIQVNDHKFSSEFTVINDWTTWSYSGIWEHQKEAQGGPFRGYLFYDGISDRTYILFLLVYHPGNDKSLLLKQLDFIAHTFFVDTDSFQ